jgi:chemotaxis protein CheD
VPSDIGDLPVYSSLPVASAAPVVRDGIGELAVGGADARLKSSGFGSCVGVTLCDPEAGVVGLLHAMLPVAPADLLADGGADHPPARYADEGVRALVAATVEAGATRSRLVAKLIGGSRMFAFGGTEGTIGDRNVEAARATLAALGIPVVAEDVGGAVGRSVELTGPDGDLLVTRAVGEDRVI